MYLKNTKGVANLMALRPNLFAELHIGTGVI